MTKKRLGKRRKLELIKDSGGILTEIARRAGVHRTTVAAWRDRDEDIAQALELERESLVDLAECVIKQALLDGDAATARYVTSTLGRNRGYTTKSEIDSTIRQTGQVQIYLPDNGREPTDQSEPLGPLPNTTSSAPVVMLPDNGRE